jgi:rhodanese-related sulfurtransferase
MDGEISPEEVEELRHGDSPPRIVDIRQPVSFAREHIPGSENIPFNELPSRVDSLAGAAHIVTVCPHGQASVQAARLIKSYEGTGDARVESMAGGLDAWEGDLDADVEQATADEGPDAPF